MSLAASLLLTEHKPDGHKSETSFNSSSSLSHRTMSSHYGEAKHTGRAYSKGKNKKSRYYVSLQSGHCVHWALKWEASVKEQKRISCEGTTSVSSALCSLRSIHYLHLFRSYTKPCPLALWIDSRKGWVVVVVGCQKRTKPLRQENIYIEAAT